MTEVGDKEAEELTITYSKSCQVFKLQSNQAVCAIMSASSLSVRVFNEVKISLKSVTKIFRKRKVM